MMHGARRVLLAACMAAVGCSTDTDTSDRPLFDNGVNVFEAQVIDGLTGGRVMNAKVTVHVGRHLLEAENNDAFYTVYGIPYGTFRISATAPGYNTFYAIKNFKDSHPTADRLSDGDPFYYYFNNLIIYPTGNIPGDIIVSVYDGTNGAPVPNATVVASLANLTTLISVDNPLSPGVGILPTTVAASTDASGKATIPAAQLIMGATYSVDVFGALDADGVYMVPAQNSSVQVGFTVQEIVVFMSRPALTPVAIMANNEAGDPVAHLEVTFPYAIELCSEDDDHTWDNTTNSHSGRDDSDNDGVVTVPLSTGNQVTASLQNDGTTLRLEPVYETEDAGDDLWITFYGVSVKPKGSSDGGCRALTSVSLRNSGGDTVDTEILVRDVPGVP